MPTLTKPYRTLLESVTGKARARAEVACLAALENLAVHEKSYRAHMTSPEVRDLRNRLRARGRALGDRRHHDGTQDLLRLKELAAYEHWHRLLFTRFLTENQLLLTDEANGSVPVTLAECEELAPELGARDGFELACRFASQILPGVFRRDDPVLDLSLALNDQVELRKLLTSLPAEVFRADDALGWTYQFWQAQRKDEINAAGKKIGADELPAVTQLFTEDYMVEFLLHNTLGAWWAGKVGPIQAACEAEARAKAALPTRGGLPAIEWTYLRFLQDEDTQAWRPAAGTFDRWPRSAAEIRLLDPCMGSGHFLVFALPLVARLRMEEESLSAKTSVAAVIQDNLHGLEIDERCTQIAAFNVALTAWKLAGYQRLPQSHLACCGLAPIAKREDWLNLTAGTPTLRFQMGALYDLFQKAPVLGSLINPRADKAANYGGAFQELQPLLERALAQEPNDDNAHEIAVTARGLARAADILADQFTLVITNFPFLGLGKMVTELAAHVKAAFYVGRQDLSSAFLLRAIDLIGNDGTIASISPSEWTFSPTYREIRRHVLQCAGVQFLSTLGNDAFVSKIRANPLLGIYDAGTTYKVHLLDVAKSKREEKPLVLCSQAILSAEGSGWLKDPDCRLVYQPDSDSECPTRLQDYADARSGLYAGDIECFEHYFWEVDSTGDTWELLQSSVSANTDYGGRSLIVLWELEQGRMFRLAESVKHLNHAAQNWRRGKPLWGRLGAAVSLMGDLAVTIYGGERYNKNCCAIVPKDAENLEALVAYCMDQLGEDVRAFDRSLKVDSPQTLLNLPFDLAHWRKVAAEKYPYGLPKPYSSDPTQWLFNGSPKGSDQPLHVGVARLLGYRWPRQTGSSFPDCPALGPDGLETIADSDGIVCLSPLKGEQPAAARLRRLLTAALGPFDEKALLASAGLKGSKSRTLEDWLRDEFFEQHAKMFHDRPFIWHLWDGRPDGFHVLVNYHKLDHANLQKLTYSHLGDWIHRQEEAANADKPGAAARLGAARTLQAKLAAVLEGEAPLDIFVRWKPLKDQPLGWHPDLNDGIRQNVRPFLLTGDVGKKGAGLFRAVPLALKSKDRGIEPVRAKEEFPWFWCESEPGTDPAGGEEFVGARWNQVHLTLATKRAAVRST